MKSKQKITPRFASNFWYDEPDFDSDVLSSETVQSDSARLYKLSAAKRAISNFVRIVVPDKPIKTTFQGSLSYTDGNSVIIGANVDDISKFDSAVGLALHEAAHIKLSDFSILSSLQSTVISQIGSDAWVKLVESSYAVGFTTGSENINNIKEILNYVEDRRIDQYIYDTAPGYRDYYRALYDKYFNDSLITKALKSDECTDETYENYSFRLINLHAEGSRLNALKGLPEIWKVLDLGNISRLTTTLDALRLAVQIYEIILKNLTPPTTQSSEKTKKSKKSSSDETSENGEGTSSNKNSESNESESGDSSLENMSGDETGSSDESSASSNGSGSVKDSDSSESDDTDSTDGEGNGEGESSESQPTASSDGERTDEAEDEALPKLTENQKKQMQKKIAKQKDFIQGNYAKKALSKSDTQMIQQIEQSGSELIEVGDGQHSKIKCILIRKVSMDYAENSNFPFYTSSGFNVTNNQKAVSQGVRMGKRLAGKLQLRSDTRSTEYNRLRSGKIDRKMLSMLGAGQSNVFFSREVDSYNKANLHISLDGSSSMSGNPWYQALMTTTALIKAIEEIPNLEVQVSVRGTQSTGRSGEFPLIAIVYDSRVDKFSKVLKLFPHLIPRGTTPEGLTFQAIMGEMISGTGTIDSYFLNMSDGQPYFPAGGYGGDYAVKHTRKQVQSLESMGIKVLSYFINSSDFYMDEFRKMYGLGAKRIDTENISQIARTMNEMFLAKN
jgi:hypothetical protein